MTYMMHDDNLARAEELLRNDHRAERIDSPSAGVANHVRIALL